MILEKSIKYKKSKTRHTLKSYFYQFLSVSYFRVIKNYVCLHSDDEINSCTVTKLQDVERNIKL